MQDVPYGYCHCGCGEKTGIAPQTERKRGYVKGEPVRYRPGHVCRLSPHAYTVEDRGYETPCWVWARALSAGYGRVKHGLAYRIEWEKLNGPVPDGLELDHLCRVRACVNPAHLEPVTHAENCRRGNRSRLTNESAAAIRRSTEDSRVLADRYGVSRATIYAVRRGEVWQPLN